MSRSLLIFLFPMALFAQESMNVSFLDHWFEDTLVTSSSEIRYNECFGFEKNGNEYAVIGSTEGSHLFRLTENNTLEAIDFVEGKFNSPQVYHRDYARYKEFLYAVCDEGESSLQIIDLTYLPDSLHVVREDEQNFARVHNIFIDTTHALLYACLISKKESNTVQTPTPLEVFSLADPTHPSLVFSGPTDVYEVHDAYVRNNIAYLNCGFDGLRVYDFTTPSDPVFLQNLSFYQDQGYNHQGWLSPDGQTYIFGDETSGKKIKKCSVNSHELSIVSNFGTNAQNNSIPHNMMLSDDFAYVAYYNEGLRIYDTRPTLPLEVAFYDTYPPFEEQDNMRGAWGVHADYSSGRIVVSDRVHGLFLLDFREDLFLGNNLALNIYPNPVPSGMFFNVLLPVDMAPSFELTVIDLFGKTVFKQTYEDQSYAEINAQFAHGTYILQIDYTDEFDENRTLKHRVVIVE